jgi:hypothetical protein
MDLTTKKKMIEILTKIQRSLCSYDGFPNSPAKEAPSLCDCKYGADSVGGGHEKGNGCPEIRDVVTVIEQLTKSEFQGLLKRYERACRKRVRKMEKQAKKRKRDYITKGSK